MTAVARKSRFADGLARGRAGLLAAVLALAGCGEGYVVSVGTGGYGYYGYYGFDYRYEVREENCRSFVYPAVVVDFRAAEDGDRLGVIADGDLYGSGGRERLQIDREAGSGLVYSLAGGFDRAGTFDVVVDARRPGDAASQRFEFNNVYVDADRCGPVTVFLDAVLN